MPSLAEVELPVTISPTNIATPEVTPGVHISSQLILQTNPDYITSMSGKQYQTINTQLECEETLHPDSYMFFCQELIEEVTAYIGRLRNTTITSETSIHTHYLTRTRDGY